MQLTEQLLGHKLGIGGDTLQQKDGHDGDGKQLKLQIVGLPLIRFSWKWGINSIMGNIIGELGMDFTAGLLCLQLSCSWILFLVFGSDIDYLHYFSKSLLTGAFFSWILKHAVVKSTIWINIFLAHTLRSTCIPWIWKTGCWLTAKMSPDSFVAFLTCSTQSRHNGWNWQSFCACVLVPNPSQMSFS